MKIKERHDILWNSIGHFEEEQFAYSSVGKLFFGSLTYICAGNLLASYIFCLYNNEYHPFRNILINEEGKIFF